MEFFPNGYKIPDPILYFYKERLLGIRNSELRNFLISREYLKGKLAKEAGGGGLEEFLFQIRTDFRITPFWKGEVITDENGFASEAFDLPDSLTSFVIMAVAQICDSQSGSTKKEIRVSKPLMLFPALPRFLIIGDKLEGGIRIQNNTKEKKEFSIKVKSLSQNLKILKDEEKIILPPEGSHLFTFPMEASSHGIAKVQFLVTFESGSREEKDAVEVGIPVKIPKIRIDSASYGSSDGRETLKISVPENIYKDAGGLRISLSDL